MGKGKLETRPPFIISSRRVPETRRQYPNSDEFTGYERAIGFAAGLLKIGVNLKRLPPGERSSWPHAEEKEEEFVYVLDGNVNAWVDGVLYPMRPGDFAAFPSGTGVCHCFVNNSRRDALLLVGGEASRRDSRIYYPLHPQRRGDMPWSAWWDNVPKRPQGPHDGLPNKLRQRTMTANEEKPRSAAHPQERR
jgi:uncharacterized cupin superfamily protein